MSQITEKGFFFGFKKKDLWDCAGASGLIVETFFPKQISYRSNVLLFADHSQQQSSKELFMAQPFTLTAKPKQSVFPTTRRRPLSFFKVNTDKSSGEVLVLEQPSIECVFLAYLKFINLCQATFQCGCYNIYILFAHENIKILPSKQHTLRPSLKFSVLPAYINRIFCSMKVVHCATCL